MPKFTVRIPEVHTVTITVDADSKEQALKKAEKIVAGETDVVLPEPMYDYTIETDGWGIDEEI